MTPPTDNTPTVLSRSAKAIASVVEAGGPEPTPFMRAAMFDDDMKPKTVGKVYREPLIAVLKEYVREDVVVWYQDREGRCAKSPSLLNERWVWTVGRMDKPDIYGGDECPTEAHIAFLEAIASVVAGEKGMGEGTVFKNPGSFDDVHKLHPPETFGRMEINDGR